MATAIVRHHSPALPICGDQGTCCITTASQPTSTTRYDSVAATIGLGAVYRTCSLHAFRLPCIFTALTATTHGIKSRLPELPDAFFTMQAVLPSAHWDHDGRTNACPDHWPVVQYPLLHCALHGAYTFPSSGYLGRVEFMDAYTMYHQGPYLDNLQLAQILLYATPYSPYISYTSCISLIYKRARK